MTTFILKANRLSRGDRGIIDSLPVNPEIEDWVSDHDLVICNRPIDCPFTVQDGDRQASIPARRIASTLTVPDTSLAVAFALTFTDEIEGTL